MSLAFAALGKVSICAIHDWTQTRKSASVDGVPSSEVSKQPITVCTMCNNCSSQGMSCDHNGIRENKYRYCGCYTKAVACWDCGICKHCAKAIWVGEVISNHTQLFLASNLIGVLS